MLVKCINIILKIFNNLSIDSVFIFYICKKNTLLTMFAIILYGFYIVLKWPAASVQFLNIKNKQFKCSAKQ